MTRRACILFSVSMVLGAGLFYVVKAHAFFRRLSPHACWQNPAGALTGTAFAGGGAAYLSNTSTSAATFLFCPIPDDTNLPKNTIRTINAHGRTATGVASPHAGLAQCVVFWDQLGSDCGATLETTATGVWTLAPPVNVVWSQTDSSHSAGFPYVTVTLPPSGTGSNVSALFGLFLQ
jgi:hypothetical protein